MAAAAVLLAVWTPVSAKDKWLTVQTQNFTVVSNASEGDARQVGLKLEQFRAIFIKLFKISPTSAVPITVLVFKNSDSFKPFKPLYNGKPANVAGYFQRGDDENIIALELGAGDERPLGVIFHEYTHLLTAYSPRPWPVWLQEGIAELYSTFEVKKNEVTIGSPVSSHVYRLRDNKFIPLDRLIRVAHDSPEYNERNRQGILYAESWAFAHYLMFGNKGTRQPQLLDELLHDVQFLAPATGELGPVLAPSAERSRDEPARGERKEGHDVIRLVDGQPQVRLGQEEIEAHRRHERGHQPHRTATQLGHDDREDQEDEGEVRRRGQ